MRHKAAVTKGPQKVIQFLQAVTIGDMNMHTIVESIGLFSQAAGELLPCDFSTGRQNVKIDFGHDQGMARARLNTNSDNIGTGLPVLPLA